MSRRVPLIPLALAVVLAGMALRPTLAVVGPLLGQIQADTGLSDVTAGLLTTLPVLLMGLLMFSVEPMRRLMGERAGVGLGIVLVAVASLIRWPGVGEGGLVVTALLGGLGIAVVQALMPRVIHERGGASSASLMGLYTTGIMGGALVASGAAPWIARDMGWPTAMGVWAVPALIGAVVWWMALTKSEVELGSETCTAPRARQGIWRHRRPWQLMALFGLGTGAYTLVLAWLPPYFLGLGWSAEAAGGALAFVTLVEVMAGLAVSFFFSRIRDRRPVLLTCISLTILGLITLATVPTTLPWLAIILIGLGIGTLFPMGLITCMDHARSGDEAGRLLAFVQGGGYILAALMPVAAGYLRQNFSDLTPAWWLMVGLCLILAGLASLMKPGQTLTTD